MTLKELEPGKSAVITAVGGEGALRQHFLDMGVIPGTRATLVQYAPMGDPMELRIHGYELTLRLADAAEIDIDESTITDKPPIPEQPASKPHGRRAHPGLGEDGIYLSLIHI